MLRSAAFFIVICGVVGGVRDNVGINSHLVKANDVVTTEAFSTASAQTANETELSIHIAIPETNFTPGQKANVLVIIRDDGRRSITLKDLGTVNFHLSIMQRHGSVPRRGELFGAMFALKSNQTIENGGSAKMMIDISTLAWSDVLSSGGGGHAKKNLFESVAPGDYYLIAELDLPPETTKDNPEAKSVSSAPYLVEIKKTAE
jgi:hypothetical protein